MADEQDSRVRDWNGKRLLPGKIGKNGLGLVKLGCADQQGEAACGSDQAGRNRNHFGEALYGTEGYQVEAGWGGEGLGAIGVYIYVCQYKGAGHFAEEGGFFLIRFDQGEGDVRGPEFDGESGQASTGAQVSDARAGKIFNPRAGHRGHRGLAQPGHRRATGEQVAFQRTSISMYVDISCSWSGERRAGFLPASAGSEGQSSDEITALPEIPRKGWSSSAIRAWFIGNEIVE